MNTKKNYKQNWKLLPCYSIDEHGKCTCGKSECESSGKHPKTFNGSKAATSDPATIKEWFGDGSNVNVAIATGSASGFFVLDVDQKHGGLDSLRLLEEKNGPMPKTVTVNTGGGGKHFYFQLADFEVRNRAHVLAGLDIRGEGGYVIAPPSRHSFGTQYEWQVGCGPDEVGVAEAPAWLLELLKGTGQREEPQRLSGRIRLGERNNQLASIAGSLRHKGVSEEAIFGALKEVNRFDCEEPISESELGGIAKSISRYVPKSSFESVNILHLSELAAYPDYALQWMVPGLLPKVGVAGIFGKPKTFKSTLARQLALSVSTGSDFLGRRVSKGRVLYFALEDHGSKFNFEPRKNQI